MRPTWCRGGDVPDEGTVVDGVLAPLYYRALFEPFVRDDDGPAPGDRVRALVGTVLRGSGAAGEGLGYTLSVSP